MKFVIMKKPTVRLLFVIAAIFCSFKEVSGANLRLRQALLSSGDWLNDIDGDNIPGEAGVDYPVYSSVPEGTSFRCKDYDYAGYFADLETDCQAYHVCFPDGRNASFLCVNGTVFHQRYFVCDWWFHSNCSLAPSLFDLNLYRKIPLPVLPPVKRRQFPGPAPQPTAERIPSPPRQQPREPNNFRTNPESSRKDNKDPTQKKKLKDLNKSVSLSPNEVPKLRNKKPALQDRTGRRNNDNCNCQCGSSPAAMYAASAVQYDEPY